jgi:hypothetical protein
MPNLFPLGLMDDDSLIESNPEAQVNFGKTWLFDFENGDFVLSPIGKFQALGDVDAWAEWGRKAIRTARYQFLAYDDVYGQEFKDLISRSLSRSGNESEIKRIVTETLIVDPRTETVDNFTFEWDGDAVFFSFEMTNVRGENVTISESVVMSP